MRTRKMVLVSMLLMNIVSLTACGQKNIADIKGTEAAAATGTEVKPTLEPKENVPEEPKERTVKTVNGDVTIPANPQRVVATYYVGELAALGIKSVGTVTRQLGEKNPNLAEYTEGMADIGDFPPNLEAITALEPDLIIATDFDGITYEDYAKIAPTIILPWVAEDVNAKLRSIAALFNKEAEAEKFIAESEAKVVAAREEIKGYVDADETFSIIRFFGKSIRVYGGRDIGHSLYNSLQLTPSPVIKEAMEKDPNFNSTEDVSLEVISKYAADRIFVVVTDEDGDRYYDELQSLSVWKDLPAVKNNKVYKIPADKWFTYDPISINVTLDEAVRILQADGPK
jgi:iron complex transport system substrate-binding protein